MFFMITHLAPTGFSPLSLHDALPISAHGAQSPESGAPAPEIASSRAQRARRAWNGRRSEEHTSELQSPCNLVCRLLLEKKNKHDSQSKISPSTNVRGVT